MYIVDSAVPACRRRPGRRNTGLRTAATTSGVAEMSASTIRLWRRGGGAGASLRTCLLPLLCFYRANRANGVNGLFYFSCFDSGWWELAAAICGDGANRANGLFYFSCFDSGWWGLAAAICGDEKRLPWGSLGGYFLDFLDFLVGLAIPSRARSASTVGSLPRNAL